MIRAGDEVQRVHIGEGLLTTVMHAPESVTNDRRAEREAGHVDLLVRVLLVNASDKRLGDGNRPPVVHVAARVVVRILASQVVDLVEAHIC